MKINSLWFRYISAMIILQSTKLGHGYVVSGGAGQRQITVVVEAKETMFFRIKSEIYGY